MRTFPHFKQAALAVQVIAVLGTIAIAGGPTDRLDQRGALDLGKLLIFGA